MEAYVSRVTANGADLQGVASFSEAVALIFEGVNLGDAFIEVRRAGVVYTPLVKSSSRWYYLLGDNGDYQVYVNDVSFSAITIEGVVIPSFLPITMFAYQTDKASSSITEEDRHNVYAAGRVDCVNYPYLISDVWPNFGLEMNGGISGEHVVTYHNCRRRAETFFNVFARIIVTVIDETQPAYVEINGFIVFVFNYEQQRRRRR